MDDDDGHFHYTKLKSKTLELTSWNSILSSTRKFSHGMSLVHTGTVQLHQEVFLWNQFYILECYSYTSNSIFQQ